MTTSAAVSAKVPAAAETEIKIRTEDLDVFYGKFHAVKKVHLNVRARTITSIIGPSGCGKSTLLRCFNRMNDTVRSFRAVGKILLDEMDVRSPRTDLAALRKRVGMVFQRPNPFPLSVFENVAYGPKVHGEMNPSRLRQAVEKSLTQTGLWDELKDRLQENALSLSAEQQQRLCISRLLAVEPEVLLMDEPCSALDPIATRRIEELMHELKSRYTILIVTHNMQQAARISQETGFMLLGDLVEFGATQTIFKRPQDKRTEDYVTGRYG
jgi:phosphate transport system ATP-binding protein